MPMILLRRVPAAVLSVACGLSCAVAWGADGYFRFPALRDGTVVFTAEGDLWSVPVTGGEARRLTTHAAEEAHAAISPDGHWLAFSAAYEGPQEAYVMPLHGGLPQRISFENSQVQVLGWTAQGRVLYRAPHTGGATRMVAVVAVDPQTLQRSVFPLADANDAVLDNTGRWLYFIRFGLAMTGDNARGYRGGALSQLWRHALDGDAEAQRIGPRDMNLRRPMWSDGRLIVVADGEGRDNLWSLAADGGDARPLTRHRNFDVRGAQLHDGRVVYQLGADLHLFSLADGSDKRLDIRLVSDFDQRRERWIDNPLRFLDTASFAPAGDSVVVTARGRSVVATTGPRRRVGIGAPAGSRISAAVLSPDDRTVYAICDASGEEEIWRFAADGSGSGEALTHDGGSQRWGLYLSPDGKRLAHDDKRGRLWLLDLATGVSKLIDDGGADGNEGYADVVWARDSRHLALVRATSSYRRKRIALLSIDDGRLQWLTSDKYESASPTFSIDGQWLWFLSDRHFQAESSSPWGDRNVGPTLGRSTKVYALALQQDLRFPFQPPDELMARPDRDEENDKAKDKDKNNAADRKGKSAPASLPAIDWKGLAGRLHEVPLPAGRYRSLQAGVDRLYFLERDNRRWALKSLPIGNDGESVSEVLDNVAEYQLSADGRKMYLRAPGGGERNSGRLYIAPATAALPAKRDAITVRIADWTVRIDPPAEWRQMFGDAWRMHRDYFFDDDLRGVDWEAVRANYEPLLARITDRHELDDVLAQMMSELGALHSQMRGGDFRSADDTATAAGLGARFERVARGWQVAHIYRTEAELPSERGPLQAPGIDVRTGDVILAVNGRTVAQARDISDLLRNQAGRQVLLEIARGDALPRRVIVEPVSAQAEQRLRYNDWVQGARQAVEQAGDGQIGYLHLYAMGSNDLATFVREFYAQYERGGLIIDVRRNRGGNIESWIIEKLLRRAWAFWARPNGQPYTNMQNAFRGHLVVLTDEFTYSDGETFAAGIKMLGLGPLIGMRTAGAGVWLGDRNSLVDGGRARVAEFPQYGMDGQWLIEGVGVEPDIEVENLPRATFTGQDAQLQAAIDWLKAKLAGEPVPALRPGEIPAS